MDTFNGRGDIKFGRKNIPINDIKDTLASNAIFSKDDIRLYDRFNRYGFIDFYRHEGVLKEFAFFTKPDLFIIAQYGGLRIDLANIPFFKDSFNRYTNSIYQLQNTNIPNKFKTPFMNIFTNTINSKIDIPDISSDSTQTTGNIMGIDMSIRGHSYKSDNGGDFNVSIVDTSYLEVYHVLKIYDEYMRLLKLGEISPFKKYIVNNIVSDQFSVYKFLIAEDGETIKYFCKFTGCYFNNVPRGDFSDPSDFGKFSVSVHYQDISDSNPIILNDFNRTVKSYSKFNINKPLNVYNNKVAGINNEWAKVPYVVASNDKRSERRAPYGANRYFDYRLKWF